MCLFNIDASQIEVTPYNALAQTIYFVDRDLNCDAIKFTSR